MSGRQIAFMVGAVLLLCGGAAVACTPISSDSRPTAVGVTALEGEIVMLPEVVPDSETSVEAALLLRRSVRDYQDAPISLSDLGQLLWAAQGVTRSGGRRTAPSAGALYPLELYAVVGYVDGLEVGVYHYDPHDHRLARVAPGDRRAELAQAALEQDWMADGAVIIVLAAVYERTTVKYGERGNRYVHMEVGAAAENVYLQAESLGLGTVFVGAFDDDEVRRLLRLPAVEEPLCLMPVGKPAP